MKEFHAAREAGLQLTYVDTGDEQYVTVFENGNLHGAMNTHPNFERIIEALEATPVDPAKVVDLFDVARAVERRFLSERVAVNNGIVYFDGEAVDDTITKQIVRFLDEGSDDFAPLVAFMEKIATNPNEHSRSQLYDWLRDNEFTITLDGDIVAYKGVQHDGEGGYESIQSGQAIVDGTPVTGRIPNAVGSVIEMPRGDVAHNPAQGCAAGLHVATFRYARGWGDTVLRVLVNPRDVVSVPTQSHADKVRVCRYKVDAIIAVANFGALYNQYQPAACPECDDGPPYDQQLQ